MQRFPLYTTTHLLLLLNTRSNIWFFFLTTSIAVSELHHVHFKTHPEEGFLPNTRIFKLPPFVTCSGHPSRCWPRSPLLNFRDQEKHSRYRITRKASSLARQSKLPLYRPLHFPPSEESFVPKLNVCSTWMFGNATVSIVHNNTPGPNTCLSSFLTSSTVVPGRHHVRTWTQSPEFTRLGPKKAFHQTHDMNDIIKKNRQY
jgi:hypothetical protein